MALHDVDIFKGESKNVEFKVELPKRSEKYMKSDLSVSKRAAPEMTSISRAALSFVTMIILFLYYLNNTIFQINQYCSSNSNFVLD